MSVDTGDRLVRLGRIVSGPCPLRRHPADSLHHRIAQCTSPEVLALRASLPPASVTTLLDAGPTSFAGRFALWANPDPHLRHPDMTYTALSRTDGGDLLPVDA